MYLLLNKIFFNTLLRDIIMMMYKDFSSFILVYLFLSFFRY
jgi:hypothetical protein